MALAENLRYARRQMNLAQTDVADILGTDYNTISRYENGKTEPRLETLDRLAGVYGRTIDQLRGPSLEELHKLSLRQERQARAEADTLEEAEELEPADPDPVQLVVTLRHSQASLDRALAQVRRVHRAVFGGTPAPAGLPPAQ